jgi:glycosyltransferase involved in cell wall biosynthesis
MKVVIVSENISLKMGGEASLGMHYFKHFRSKGIHTLAICHGRVRDELQSSLSADEIQHFLFVDDTPVQAVIWRVAFLFPVRVRDLLFSQIIHVLTMRRVRQLVRRACANAKEWICLEPSPISPLGLSFMFRLDMPVVIGPLCGGLEFPPAFRFMDGTFSRLTVAISRQLARLANHLVPGKLEADALLVANECTRRALPPGYRGKVYEVVESGVDLSLWSRKTEKYLDVSKPVRFVFSGRFVDWKGVAFLLSAFAAISVRLDAELHLIGDGELRGDIEDRIRHLGLESKVRLHGWKSRAEAEILLRECDVFVMPSLRECGGTAILEAMAMGLPVIATNWAGPSSYINNQCGILVDPLTPDDFTKGLADAMVRLAEAPGLRIAMGRAGMERVKSNYFDWNSKADRVLEILQQTLLEFAGDMHTEVGTQR